MTQHWQKITIKLILSSLLLTLLGGCGFHLRGAQDVSEEKRQVTLIAGNSSRELLQTLRQNMKFNGMQETANAAYQLHILNHNYKRRTATVSNSSVDEYELILSVTVMIADREGNPLSKEIRIQRERYYSYDKDAAAASSEQETLLRRELYNAVAQNILRLYLSSNQKNR
ncbi:LPS assembly lipoprotein LptE [Neptuniibacter halophilus]|uniref:LPS-assembly lipoprotein LptE n=1 Tax=Neptuniibacter halophilus TaxID=651666 RepID=UPI00257388C2|nr:LPS assembly lipoprotein LptE [Neptuniibacter halophilus]